MIKLEPHIGISCSPSGHEVRLPQDRIIIDGRLAGYVGHKKGDYVQLLREISEAERHELDARIIAKFGEERPWTGPPILVTQELLDALDGE